MAETPQPRRGRRGRRPDLEIASQVYKDDRPAETFDSYHARTRDHEPEWVYELVRMIITPLVVGLFRARAHGSENVPNGPVIIAPNHASFMDHFLCGAFVRRHIQFMAKSQYFRAHSLVSWVFSHGGVFPVRRGHRDEEAFLTAETILARGGCLGMYVEGGRTRTGQISDEAKPGMGRLALVSGAPIVPVAIVGSGQIRNWRRGHFPRVEVHFGEAFAFEPVPDASRGQQQAVADEVLRRIRDLYEAHA